MSAPAAGVYLLLLLASFGIRPAAEPIVQRTSWRVLALLAPTALGAGIWFIAVQHFQLHTLCPWCVSVHVCALLIVLMVIAARWKMSRLPPPAGRGIRARRLWPWTLAAALPLTVLIAGQTIQKPQRPVNHVSAAEGKLKIDPANFPVLGKPDAAHVLIIMADYCCPHCRRMHSMLERTQTRFGSQLAVVMLPVPINSSCNPAIATTPPNARNACELARVALAVWHAKPAAFAEMNDWLFEGETPPQPQAARSLAARLIGEAQLNAALADPAVNATLRLCVQAYADIGEGPVPKAILPISVLSGEIQDESALYELIEREMHIQPGL